MIFTTPLGIPILTWKGLGWLFLLCFVIGIAGSIVVPFFFQLLENSKWAKARRKRETNAELQRKYESVCAELIDERNARKLAEDVEGRVRELLREERKHNVDWDRRADKELAERSRA